MDAKPLELRDAASRLKHWEDREENALRAGNHALASVARRFSTEYALLVAELRQRSAEASGPSGGRVEWRIWSGNTTGRFLRPLVCCC